MCRHIAYLGPEIALDRLLLDPPHGLCVQSWAPRQQRHGIMNADGFGIGWYPLDTDQPPARYRRAVPIWADPNVPSLTRALRSRAVLAAVRSATEGTSQDEGAAAPFRDGHWLFSHNGAIPDWTRLPAALGADCGLEIADLLTLEARSDSALLWAILSRRLRQGEPAADALTAVLQQIAAVRPDARLNLLLTNGRVIIASRYGETLWYRKAPDSVLVASEPNGEGTWQEVPEQSLLIALPGDVRLIQLRPAAPRPSPATKNRLDMAHDFTLEHRLPEDHFVTSLRADVLHGLADAPRTLPSKWFYDSYGSDLFEQITRLPEYYPTRAEQEILAGRAPEIAALTRARTLIELGSGSSRKTRLLLDALTAAGTLEHYAPLDVSSSALVEAGEALCRAYPRLRITATVTDFERDLALGGEEGPRLLALLGSTIGNLDPTQRQSFYVMLGRALSADDALLLGVDLVKDGETLVRAYDDSQGVTAAFNKNVLNVLNRELDADFDPTAFDHLALWNETDERIEMHLRARSAQIVKIPAVDLVLELDAGESIRTEISTKFRREALTAELATGGFTVRQWWTDSAVRFAVLLAVPTR